MCQRYFERLSLPLDDLIFFSIPPPPPPALVPLVSSDLSEGTSSITYICCSIDKRYELFLFMISLPLINGASFFLYRCVFDGNDDVCLALFVTSSNAFADTEDKSSANKDVDFALLIGLRRPLGGRFDFYLGKKLF